jgi:NAD(P)-dependent dehydrogenase (short-subunit alcohol dehydrogenase family)
MSFERIETLNDKVVVITGYMGGMGKAIGKRLAARGATIIGIVRKDLSNAQTELDKLGENNLAINASIDDSVALNTARDIVREQYGKCDILINTASISKTINHQNLNDLSDDFFDEIMRVNVRGTYATIRAFAPLLIESADGLIVNITSTAGVRTGGSNIAYAASKAATDSMTRNLAKSLAPKVRVISVAPGAVDTNFLENRSAEFFNKYAKGTPLNRIGMVDDVASTIEACATSMRFMTGNCIVIDGGKTL